VQTGVLVLAVLKLTLRLELGPEYDSNANRAEVVQGGTVVEQPTGSFLLRSTARGGLAWRKGRNLLRASGLVGGKLFFNPEVQDQNMIIGQVSVEDRLRPRPWLELGIAGDYYDVEQQSLTHCTVSCDRHRDFRSGSASARLGFFDGPGELSFTGGYRGFVWKPNGAFDFHAGQGTVLALLRLHAGPSEREHEIDLSAGYHLERRIYAGPIEINVCPPNMPLTELCLVNGGATRADWFHEGTTELTWIRSLLLSVAYAVQLNRSNSFGWSWVRHVLTAKLATRLPWQLYLTIKAQLVVSHYLDPQLLDRNVNNQTPILFEDENRNAFLVDLERPIGRSGVAVEARFSVYTNELGSPPASFLRYVAYLGITYRLASR
jgi:hypothetical protein